MAGDTQPQLPTPAPALQRLDRFVGTWSKKGLLVGSDEIRNKWQTTFRWRLGGFLLEQHGTLKFLGMELDSPRVDRLRPRDRDLPVHRLHEHLPTALAVPVGDRRGHPEDLGHVRPARRDVPAGSTRTAWDPWWLASQPRCRRDGELALQHRRAPAVID